MKPSARALLLRLLETPGPSGSEAAVATIWRDAARASADSVTADVTGNSYAAVGPAAGPIVAIASHLDEVGFMITHIEDRDDYGYLHFTEIGGHDPALFVGQRVRILATGPKAKPGELIDGVVGRVGTHMMTEEDEESSPKFNEMWIDIGTNSEAETRKLIAIGDSGVIAATPLFLRNNTLVSRALDNRISAYIQLEVLRRYAAKPGAARLVVCANAREEIAQGSAGVAALTTAPAITLVLDVTYASDFPDADRPKYGGTRLRDGVAFGRGAVCSPVVTARLAATAKTLKLPFSFVACPVHTGTDAEGWSAAYDTAIGSINIPLRYMHTPNEMVDLDVVEEIITLLVRFLRDILADLDLVPR
jgi:putative aminopeptidase FrvX